MKLTDYKEFYKSLIFRNRDIQIPSLGITIDKSQFITNRGYDVEKQDIFLKKIYMSKLYTQE